MRAKAALPDDEQRPQDEQAGEHQPRQHAGKKQPADRGLGGDPVQDEGDRRRDQDAERAAGADRAGGHVVRVAAPAHFRNAHLADGGAAGGRRARERGKDRAGSDIGDHQTAGHAIEPAVERLVEVLAGGRRADRRAHHDEHGYRHQREVGQRRCRTSPPPRAANPGPERSPETKCAMAPSPKATGAPDSSTTSVTMRTMAPWVAGLMSFPSAAARTAARARSPACRSRRCTGG